MSEYITGRIDISGKESKSIKGASKGKDGDLEFIRVGSDIRVDRVPSQYGVRVGAKVNGFSKDGSTIVHGISWPNSIKKGRCNLAELSKFNDIDRNADILIVENGVKYVTHLLKNIDTKDYGLPQTRQRAYCELIIVCNTLRTFNLLTAYHVIIIVQCLSGNPMKEIWGMILDSIGRLL